MSVYNYTIQKKNIFTEEGQVLFIKIRDIVHRYLETAGAFTMGKVIATQPNIANEDKFNNWDILACVDRLVELGEIKEITDKKVLGQNRVFVENKKVS